MKTEKTTAIWDLKSQYDTYKNKTVFDCLLAEYVLSGGASGLRKEIVLAKYKVDSLEKLAHVQQERLSKEPLLKSLYENIEFPMVRVLYQMEYHGILVDKKRMEDIGVILDARIKEVSEQITKETGVSVNLSSPAQVGTMLVAKFSVPLAKTATGQYATGERELSRLASMYPVIPFILKYRTLSKLKTTYVDALLPKIAEDSRLHTTYHQTKAVSGRLSSSNPNMQNIPSSDDEMIDVKSAFLTSPQYQLVSFDYSQQELRILAHLADEEKLKEAFSQKKDIHTVTAATIFNVPYSEVSRTQRTMAKTINFGIIYGMGSYGLSQTLDIPPADAEIFIDQFYQSFPRIRSYFDSVITTAAKKGYAETILGRRRHVPHQGKIVPITDATRRELINFPIQGSAADLMKIAMVEIDKTVLSRHNDTRLLLQIHDELLFEIQETNKLPERIEAIRSIMQTVYPLAVPMEVEVKTGYSWGKMKK